MVHSNTIVMNISGQKSPLKKSNQIKSDLSIIFHEIHRKYICDLKKNTTNSKYNQYINLLNM